MFYLLLSALWLVQNSRSSLNQSNAKLTLIVTWSLAFSRATRSFVFVYIEVSNDTDLKSSGTLSCLVIIVQTKGYISEGLEYKIKTEIFDSFTTRNHSENQISVFCFGQSFQVWQKPQLFNPKHLYSQI